MSWHRAARVRSPPDFIAHAFQPRYSGGQLMGGRSDFWIDAVEF